MRIAAFIVLALHGLIHLMGFIKGFHLAEINQLSKEISRSTGILWLFAAILFITAAFLFVLSMSIWIYPAILALVISQSLIIISWSDAKWGTLINLLVLAMVIIGYGNRQFKKQVQNELNQHIHEAGIKRQKAFSHEKIKQLPFPVQKWLNATGIAEKEEIRTLSLVQKGELRTEKTGKWMPFEAWQFIDTYSPSFIWFSKVKMNSLVSLAGRDRFFNGKGEMSIRLLSLIPVVQESNNHKINTGTMLRFLGEMCWYPSAVLNENIRWESKSDKEAVAHFSISGETVSGTFRFNDNGLLKEFSAMRYFGSDDKAGEEEWVVIIDDHKEFDGIVIPYKNTVIWRLKDGDFEWLHLEITGYHPNTLLGFEKGWDN